MNKPMATPYVELSTTCNNWGETYCVECGHDVYRNANGYYHCESGNMYCAK